MIVTPDRYACVQYKEELGKYFPEDVSRLVISISANDVLEFKQKWAVDKTQQEAILDEFVLDADVIEEIANNPNSK